jgi:hypothetical protein
VTGPLPHRDLDTLSPLSPAPELLPARKRHRPAVVATGCAVLLALVAGFVAGLLVSGEMERLRDPPEVSERSDRIAPRAATLPVSFDIAPVAAHPQPAKPETGVEEMLEVLFAGPIIGAVDAAGFTVEHDASGGIVRATSTDRVRGSDDRVLVSFPPGTDLKHAAIVTVAAGTVWGRAGRTNVPNSLALPQGRSGGRPVGRIPGPELTHVDVDRTLDRVTFVFDELLERQAAASSFTVVMPDGHRSHGQRIVDVSDRRVLVDFAVPVTEAVRFGATHGSVHNRHGAPAALGAVGEATAAPDLRAVERGPGGVQLDFRFDEAVQDAVASRFTVYDHEGRAWRGKTAVRPSPDVVRVAFPDLPTTTDEQVTLAVARPGAVRSLSGQAQSTAGAVPHATPPPRVGPTPAPDPISWTRDDDTGQLVVRFDEALDDFGSPSPDSFRLVSATGRSTPMHAIVEIDRETIRLNADPADVRTAVGLTVDRGAVGGASGGRNPLASMGVEAEDAPCVTTPGSAPCATGEETSGVAAP